MHDAEYILVPVRFRGTHHGYAKIGPTDYEEYMAGRSWYMSSSGYLTRRRPGNERPCHVFLHRLILGIDGEPGVFGDHINRDRLDNRRCNLRIVTNAENSQNRGSKPGSTSRYRGVSWSRTKRSWRVEVSVANERHLLGYFEDEDEAGRIAAEFRRQHMPYAAADRLAA